MIETVSGKGGLYDHLLACLADSDFSALLALPDIDWQHLADMVQKNRISGYLYWRLAESPLRETVPGPIWEAWKHTYLRQWTKSERLASEMARLADAFGDRILFVKGPLLGQQLYGRLDVRSISDLDILLRRPDDMDAVDEELRQLGYQSNSTVFLSPAISRWFGYHYEYWHGDLALEPHWALTRHPSLKLDQERLWRERAMQELKGRVYPTLSGEYTLLAAIVSIPVDLQIGKMTLRPFFEMLLLLRQFAHDYDWFAFFARRQAENSVLMSQIVLTAVLDLFDVRDRFPALAAELDPTAAPQAAELLALLRILDGGAQSRMRSEWHCKNQAFALYNYPRIGCWAWWLFSLPARMTIHKTESRRRWRR